MAQKYAKEILSNLLQASNLVCKNCHWQDLGTTGGCGMSGERAARVSGIEGHVAKMARWGSKEKGFARLQGRLA
jgi:hypothetical protein